MAQGSRIVTFTRPFALLLLLVLLGGCFPAPHGGYYQPSTAHEPAEVRARSCGGKVGPKEMINLYVGRVEMRVRLQEKGGGIDGHIGITVPAGAKLRFLDGPFVLADEERSQRIELRPRFGGTYDVKTRTFGAERPLDETVFGSAGRSIDIRVPNFAPNRFSLTLPPVEVNDRVVTVAPIDFTYRAFDVGIYPFNC